MFEGPNKPPPKRKSQQRPQKASQAQRAELMEQILKLQDNIGKLDKRVGQQQHRHQKMVQSNMRNQKRLLRYRARIEEMTRYKDNPEYFLTVSGHMNESIQQYILTHNCTINFNQHEQPLDPDNMTYEQLIDLGDQIGKVSKGLSKEEIERLNHKRNKRPDQSCPICQNEMEVDEVVIELRCRHTYHEDCILFWLKDQNTCPICKECLADRQKIEDKFSRIDYI